MAETVTGTEPGGIERGGGGFPGILQGFGSRVYAFSV